jgi:hypothetical protein
VRLPNQEGQVHVFISPKKRVAQLYPQESGLFLTTGVIPTYKYSFRTSQRTQGVYIKKNRLIKFRGGNCIACGELGFILTEEWKRV